MRSLQLLVIGLLLVVKTNGAFDDSNTTYATSTGINDINPTAPTNFLAHHKIENEYTSTTSDTDLEQNVTDSTTYVHDEMENRKDVSFTSNVQSSYSVTLGSPSLVLSDDNITHTTPAATYSSLSGLHQTKHNEKTEEVHYINITNDFISQKGINTSKNPHSESISTSESSMSEMTSTSEYTIQENPTPGSNIINSESHMNDTLFTIKSSESLNASKHEHVSQSHSDKEIQNVHTSQLQSTISAQPETVSETKYSNKESLRLLSINSSSTFTTDKSLVSSETTEVSHSALPNNVKIDSVSQTWETTANTIPKQYQTESEYYYSYSDEDYVTTSNISRYDDVYVAFTVNTTHIMNREQENTTSWRYASIPVMIYEISKAFISTGNDKTEPPLSTTEVMNPRTITSRKPKTSTTIMSGHEYKTEIPVTTETNHVTPVRTQTASQFNEAKTTETHLVNSSKEVSVKSAANLNEGDKQIFAVTIVFESDLGIADWFLKFDDRFKQQLQETLNNCTELKNQNKTLQPNDVLHLTSSPATNGQSLLVNVVVLDPLAKEKNVYIDGHVLVSCMEKGRKQYETLVNGKIVDMFAGVPVERRTIKVSRFVLATSLVFVTIGFLVMIAVFMAIYLKKCEHRIPGPVFKEVCQRSEGQNLASDGDCTASEEQVPMQGTSTQEPTDHQEGNSKNEEMRTPKKLLVSHIDIHDTRL